MAVAFDAVGPSASGASQTTSPISWTHTCGASANALVVIAAVDNVGTGTTISATYNSVSMTLVDKWAAGGSGNTAGFVAMFSLLNPATGAHTVTVTSSAGDDFHCGSISFTGAGSFGSSNHSDSNNTTPTTGSVTLASTTSGGMLAAGVTEGSGGLSFTSGTSRFVTTVGGAGAAQQGAGATAASTGSSVTVNWNQTADWYSAIILEVLPPASASTGPPFRQAPQPIRARYPQKQFGAGLVFMGLAKGDTSFASGRTGWNAGAPARNPVSGPVFRQKTFPVQAQDPLAAQRQVGPGRRGRAYGISPGGPVRNPPPSSGPVFYPARKAVRAALRQQPVLRGRTASSPGGPVANPGAVQVSGALGGPVRASLPGNTRGRVRVTPLVPAAGTPPVHAGPPFYPARQAVRARLAQQPVLRGRITSAPGAPARNPSAGPAFRQATSPARARQPLPPHGHAASNPGGPVRNPVPAGTGPVFRPAVQAVRARLPLQPVLRGKCRAIRFGPLPANPSPGPVFTQATTPARAKLPLPPRGRTASNPGGPVQNPVPGVVGPPFYPFRWPARIRPSLPPKGRTTGSQGAPVRNPHQGAAFPAAHGPVQARFPLPPRGRASGNPGIPVPPPVTPAPVYPLHGPVRARFPFPPRGRATGNPGGPVQNPVSHTGPPFFPLHWPARIRPALPPRGRVSANPGAAVRNPGRGPAFTPKDWPCRARIPQNAPRGRTGSNPGGPVTNIPFGNPLFRLGSPRFRWDTGIPVFQWETATPVLQWDTGVPVTSG